MFVVKMMRRRMMMVSWSMINSNSSTTIKNTLTSSMRGVRCSRSTTLSSTSSRRSLFLSTSSLPESYYPTRHYSPTKINLPPTIYRKMSSSVAAVVVKEETEDCSILPVKELVKVIPNGTTVVSKQLVGKKTSENGLVLENGQQRSYEDAIKALNSLQSNLSTIKIIASNRTALQDDSLPGTIRYLERSGITMNQADTLNTIHIAGTKGKGSTCAFVESLLRHTGLKTGFYSSPHLVSTRERIRINGKPISQEKFAQYFFQAYDRMDKYKENEADMPSYFRFMTCMAFHVFLKEKLDVAIFEVGIGGKYDCTNIIRNPVVVGITSLGLDHQMILGNTVEEIAIQKAGIMKPNVPAITVSNHRPEILAVLKHEAQQTNCPLFIAPAIESYHGVLELGINNFEISQLNAEVAIQLVNTFLLKKFPEKLQSMSVLNNNNNTSSNGHSHEPFEIGKSCTLQPWHFEGLRNCAWPGRFQIIKKSDALTYYLDGAHTPESFDAVIKWYSKTVPKNTVKLLVFHITGFRVADNLLTPFIKSRIFDKVVFCPIITTCSKSSSADNWSAVESEIDLISKCKSHAKAWSDLEDNLSQKRKVPSCVCNSIDEVISYTETMSQIEYETNSGKTLSVLITGSLHLIGAFLSILDPTSCDNSDVSP